MFGPVMNLCFAIVIGILCVVQTQAKCVYEISDEGWSRKLICTDNLDTRFASFNDTPIYLRNIKSVTETVKKLKVLNYSHVTLTQSNITTLPTELLYNELKYLNISNNSIRTINLNSLPYAQKLEVLILSYNEIEDFETDSAAFISTKKLVLIDLSHNKLHHIPVNCFYSTRESLKVLNLSNNQIKSFDFFAFSSLVALETLHLSHNLIMNLGTFLYPIKNLYYLNLKYNLITDINAEDFDQSTSLVDLDLSYNSIKNIEDQSFKSLTKLRELDLNNNKLTSVKKCMLQNNTLIETLNLSFNNINFIEPGSFSLMEKLTELSLYEALEMDIQENVFTGIKVEELNLSGGKIKNIEKRPFVTLRNTLERLNLSFCGIQEISETAMDALTKLNALDLSDNQLSRISFRTIDLENLRTLNLHNNAIRVLESKTFESLFSLRELDLSNNEIQSIPTMIFTNLKNVETFKIANNILNSTLLSNTFYGLEKIEELELTNTKVQRWDSYALSGLQSLKVLNASHGQLTFIDFYAFTGTGNIEILDLSHNLLQNLNIKLLPNNKLRKVYINNNKISSFSKKIFEGLEHLEDLSLSCNELVSLETATFSSLRSLLYVDLSHNPELKLGGNVFDGLDLLDTVLLRNVSNLITFESENSLQVRHLDLSSSQISNVSSLHIHNVKNINTLDLSHNNITFLDQFSFGDSMNLSSFSWLNLSYNNLKFINPGTFLKTSSISYLDLSHNNIGNIPFGALTGLRNLHTLNLKNNILPTFKMQLLHDVPSLLVIYLDNNNIYNLGLTDKKYSLSKISVGGNNIACEELIDMQSRFDNAVTAEVLNEFTENVNGIPCASSTVEDIGALPNFRE